MLRHFGIGVAWAVGGYVIGVGVCWLLISCFSSNTHDRSMEAVMTAFFAAGPAAAILAFVAGVVYSVTHH